MSRIILVMSIAIILFAGAAGLSWYLQPHAPDADAHAKDGEAKVAKAGTKKDGAKHEPADSKPGKSLPVNLDANRTTQAMLSLQIREEAIKAREQHFDMREKQLATAIHDDIKKEHAKLELVRKDIQTELNHVKKKLEEIELRTAAVSKNKLDVLKNIDLLNSLSNQVKASDAKNAQKNAVIFDKMEPEPLSLMLTQWVEGGKTDEAALLLHNMKQSQAAAVLGELTKQDATLATKLFERMQKIQITPDKK